MTGITRQSFDINLKILKLLLLYSPEKYGYFHKILSYIVFGLFMFHLPILGVLHYVLADSIDIKQEGDNAFIITGLCCYIVKLLPFLTNSKEIRRCINYFEDVSFIHLRENHKLVLNEASRICRRNSKIFLILVTGSIITWAIKPLFFEDLKLPVDVWLPFDHTADVRIYWGLYLWFVLGAFYPAVACAVIEPLVAGLVALAAVHYVILKDNIQHFYEYSVAMHSDLQYPLPTITFYNIKLSLKHYEYILKFVKLYQNCFSQVIFSQLVGSIFVLGFCCLELILLQPGSIHFFNVLNNCCIILAQIFFYCYYGAVLIQESDSLTQAVYMSKWYHSDIKSRRALILLMERSQRPSFVTVGKMLELSLETFTTIIRRAYSIVAVFT